MFEIPKSIISSSFKFAFGCMLESRQRKADLYIKEYLAGKRFFLM